MPPKQEVAERSTEKTTENSTDETTEKATESQTAKILHDKIQNFKAFFSFFEEDQLETIASMRERNKCAFEEARKQTSEILKNHTVVDRNNKSSSKEELKNILDTLQADVTYGEVEVKGRVLLALKNLAAVLLEMEPPENGYSSAGVKKKLETEDNVKLDSKTPDQQLEEVKKSEREKGSDKFEGSDETKGTL
ncbi:hypothetical protein K491DRAFT_321954 [Lophiostoma macrostomum CBS 122681]|uniref:Uncharacterized protein n=1 Tax=Lophiostoma macrostomum CBS 122681 TaxID=1314788 RepID=A0A6A6SHC3_9PLEO|nr:hypothetical protein K491DRAFT_321954 [Lophiostoma macrostomum CBS 122681]